MYDIPSSPKLTPKSYIVAYLVVSSPVIDAFAVSFIV
nr:MAG TPA: hypothetical protein [Caudoviricetes sp.]